MLPKEKLSILKKHLCNALNKKLSVTECTELIYLSRQIITPYLIHAKSSFLSLARANGMDINDLAIDITAEAFNQDEEGNLINIIKFNENLWEKIEDINEENLFRAYQSYLRTVANSNIARIYAELDPNGFKIQRNIKETLPTDNITLRKSINGYSIYLPGFENEDHLPYLNYDEIENIFLSTASEISSTRKFLEFLRTILVNHQNHRKEIKLNDAVKLFKKYHNIDNAENTLSEDFEIIDKETTIEQAEIKQIYNFALEKMRNKLLIDYFSKGKLTLIQVKSLDSAVMEIVNDLIQFGETKSSYFDYLKHHLSVSPGEYETKYKSKLEYIIKLIKEIMRNYIYTRE